MTRAVTIKLNKSNYTKHSNNVHGTTCIHCRRQLNLGEKAVSKLVSARAGRDWIRQRALYCMSCAQDLNII